MREIPKKVPIVKRIIPKNKADREYHWEDWVQRNYWDDAVGDVRLVRKLPEEVRKRKLESAKTNVEYYQNLVKMLEKS